MSRAAMTMGEKVLPHPYSTEWAPYKDALGQVVTLDPKLWLGPVTSMQLRAILHAVNIVDEVRRTQGRQHVYQGKPHGEPVHCPPLREDIPEKSRALGRLLIEGKPLFVDMPPYEMGAAAYWIWDAENEAAVGGGGEDTDA